MLSDWLLSKVIMHRLQIHIDSIINSLRQTNKYHRPTNNFHKEGKVIFLRITVVVCYIVNSDFC